MLRICCALIDIIFIENELGDVIRFFRENARKEGVTSMLGFAKRKQGITAPFFHIKQHIFVMDNRRI